MTLPTTSAILRVNGRVLEITVADLTCDYPDCSNEVRTRRSGYCAGHASSAARVATYRARLKSPAPPADS